MTDHPHATIIRLEDFDRSQLNPEKRDLEGAPLRLAIREHFEKELSEGSGAAEVVVTEEEIILRWSSSDALSSLTDQGINFLSNGDYERGIALLKVALKSDPDDQNALLNIGMALSDLGQLEESIGHLRHLVGLDPDHARPWIALGVAQVRNEEIEAAVSSLKKAVVCDPDDGYALLNLGALLIEKTETLAEAGEILRRAAERLPENQQIWVNLGKLNEKTGNVDEADEAYLKVLEINPTTQLAQLAKDGRTRISESIFKEKGAGTRPDALMYCLGALERFEDIPVEEVQKITFEIATLGMSGLDVNDPAEKYSVPSLPGKFSGLHLLCIEYVGFKQLDPSVDLGFDLTQEFAAAKQMHTSR